MSTNDIQLAPLESWSAEEREILSLADGALSRGKQLYQWFLSTGYKAAEPPEFPLGCTFRPEDRFGGLYAYAPIDGKSVPIMGADQVTFFDRLKPGESEPKAPIDDFAAQVRAFVLRYFLTMCDFRDQTEVSTQTAPLPPLLDRLSWYPPQKREMGGFAFAKVAVKRHDTGDLYRYTPQSRHFPINLENLRESYQWLMLKTTLHQSSITLTPFGQNGPQINVPVPELSYLVLDHSLLIDQQNPEPGVVGRYGVSYAMIHHRRGTWPVVYGPGQFDAGIQMNVFDVLESGICRVRQTFLVNQPSQMISLFGFDPLFAFIDTANLFSLGLAGSRLGISRDSVCRFILFEHSMMTYRTLSASLRTFRHDDWLQLERDGSLPPELLAARHTPL